MRSTENPQLPPGYIAIEDIHLDPRCRDDITAVLRGIQFLYSQHDLREEIFTLLEQHLLLQNGSQEKSAHDGAGKITPKGGRPGMSLWEILVLALLKQGLNCDYDRLHNLACKHSDVRRMLGISDPFEDLFYCLQTVRRNIQLLTPELLAEVNRIVVEAGHALEGHQSGTPLQGRCDSFVVETDVHFPTDVNLLWDAMRRLIPTVAGLCKKHGVSGWRQSGHLLDRIRRSFNRVRSSRQRRGNPERTAQYLELTRNLVERAQASVKELAKRGVEEATRSGINQFVRHAERQIDQIDQIDRRVLQEERIPNTEKVYSIFEEHTRWCVKGKAGCAVELGVPVSVVESEHQFVLNYKIMWKTSDVDVGPELIEDTQKLYPSLRGCSFDKGYWSRANKKQLGELLDRNVLPQTVRFSKAAKDRESSPEFVAARQRHAAVESGINNLECRGLDRIREHGKDRFELMVGLSVLAANVHRIGLLRQRQERAKRNLARQLLAA